MNQHLIPAYYLKGFTTEDDSKVLWKFSKGLEYRPGKHRKFNPALLAPSAVGWKKDYYATENMDGVVDATSIETKVLMPIEQAALEGIEMIRSGSIPVGEHRKAVSKYITYLMRRGERHRKKLAEQWPESIEKVLAENKALALQALDDSNIKLPWKESAVEALEKIVEYERSKTKEASTGILNQNLKYSYSNVEAALYAMNWVLFINRSSNPFITSDYPVYFYEPAGLAKSDLTVPFSKSVVLLTTWTGTGDRVAKAKDRDVIKMNRRSVSEATEFAFAPIKDSWVLTLLDRGPYRHERLH
jgi:hypothetical protein